MNKFSLYLLAAILVLGSVLWIQQKRITRIARERDRYQMNNDALLSDMQQWQIDSATMATDVKRLLMTADDFERYRAEDAAKIKQMGVKIKNLEAAAKHELEVNAPIAARIRDSIVIRDTVPVVIKSVSMNTPHLKLAGTIENDSLVGSIHLPVTLRQAIWVEYKRRWIFWKRVKAVHQTITSDNPHVEITYSEYISIQK